MSASLFLPWKLVNQYHFSKVPYNLLLFLTYFILMTDSSFIHITTNGLISFFFMKRKKEVKSLSCVWLFVTPWTVAYQAPPSMEFSRQEYWSGLPFPSPGDPPNPGVEPMSPALQADALPSEPPGKPYSFLWLTNIALYICNITSLSIHLSMDI